MDTYWTKQPEAVLRDLMRRYGRVWCDEIPPKGMKRLHSGLQKKSLGNLPVTPFNHAWGVKAVSRWKERGGILREEPSSRYLNIDRPMTPGKLSLYCPLNQYDLAAQAIQASESFVVRVPGDWNIYRRLLHRLHPSAKTCQEVLDRVDKYRANDFEVACARALGHLDGEVGIASGEGFTRMVAISTKLAPSSGPDSVWPVKLLNPPLDHANEQFHATYNRIADLAAVVDGWSLVTPGMWSDGIPDGQVRMLEFAGHVLSRPKIYFFSHEPADLDAAQHYHQGSLDALETLIRKVDRWERYPLEEGAVPLKRALRRAVRSPSEPSDEPDEGRLPDIASQSPA